MYVGENKMVIRRFGTQGGKIRTNEDRSFCQEVFCPYGQDVVILHYYSEGSRRFAKTKTSWEQGEEVFNISFASHENLSWRLNIIPPNERTVVDYKVNRFGYSIGRVTRHAYVSSRIKEWMTKDPVKYQKALEAVCSRAREIFYQEFR
jgi:hypothetical protein